MEQSALRGTGMCGKELGELFGNVSGAAITVRHKAVSEKIRKHKGQTTKF